MNLDVKQTPSVFLCYKSMSHGELAHLHRGTTYAHIVGSIFRETELLLKNNKIIVLPSFILQIEVRMDITLKIDVD